MGTINAKDVSEGAKKKLRPTVHMGGSVTKNGKNVDKQIERQTAAKYKRSTSDGFMAKRTPAKKHMWQGDTNQDGDNRKAYTNKPKNA